MQSFLELLEYFVWHYMLFVTVVSNENLSGASEAGLALIM